MKKIGILIEKLFDERELIYPYYRLREDFEVLLIGTEANKSYAAKSGFAMMSDVASKDVRAEDLDGLFIPGGYSPDHMRRSQASKDLVRAMHDARKPLAAICHAGWMLASSIDLKGLKMTSYHSIKDDMVHAGADWIDQETVVDRMIFTGRDPEDLPSLVTTFVKSLQE